MSLTEKTLELNVTHEIIENANVLWRQLWQLAAPALAGGPEPEPPKAYVSGLSQKQEEIDGYDVRIELPASFGPAPRIAFVQYKLGKQRSYTRKAGSKFLDDEALNPHLLYGINNNSHMNQHGRLKTCAAGSGCPESAIYAFPAFASEKEVKEILGRLALRTKFITALDIDAVCNPAIRDGVKHSVAISKENLDEWEVRSEPKSGPPQGDGDRVISDIFAVRAYRALAVWRGHLLQARPSEEALATLYRSVAAQIGRYVRVDGDTVQDAFQVDLGDQRSALDRFSDEHDAFVEKAAIYSAPDESLPAQVLRKLKFDPDADRKRRGGILRKIVGVGAPVWESLREGSWLDTLPAEPKTVVAATANDEGRYVRLPGLVDRETETVPMFSYQIF